MLKKLFCVVIGCLISVLTAYAEESQTSEKIATKVEFVEEDSADCSISDGKLISIQNTDSKQTLQVWVDRWFMNVQTADHTEQTLLPKTASTPLGCSIARTGGKQHWTIYSIKAIE